MQEHGAAAAGDARARVVVDLDDEVVEMILAGQPVAGLAAPKPDRLVVMAVGRVFAPGVLGADWPNGGGQTGPLAGCESAEPPGGRLMPVSDRTR